MKPALEGILPVWKPQGFTSHDVVAKVRRMTGNKRIGHTGTLDPQVTGVLPLCIGRATRLVEYIQELPKEYEARMKIGLATDTEDMTGTVISEVDRVELTREAVERAIQSFLGEIEQVPPMYSAVKVDGKRLYELARQGVEVERKSRKVTIYEIELLSCDLSLQHPELHFRALCSKGTYIRTLCVDLGKALGYPSVMSELIRTSTGHLRKEQCLTLEEIQVLADQHDLQPRLISMEDILKHLPKVILTEKQTEYATTGRQVTNVVVQDLMEESEQVTAFTHQGQFLGIFEYNRIDKALKPIKVFL